MRFHWNAHLPTTGNSRKFLSLCMENKNKKTVRRPYTRLAIIVCLIYFRVGYGDLIAINYVSHYMTSFK